MLPKFLNVPERFSNNLFSRKYLRDFSALVSELALRSTLDRSNAGNKNQWSNKIDYICIEKNIYYL